jgi:hypothetical protein
MNAFTLFCVFNRWPPGELLLEWRPHECITHQLLYYNLAHFSHRVFRVSRSYREQFLFKSDVIWRQLEEVSSCWNHHLNHYSYIPHFYGYWLPGRCTGTQCKLKKNLPYLPKHKVIISSKFIIGKMSSHPIQNTRYYLLNSHPNSASTVREPQILQFFGLTLWRQSFFF